MIKKQCSTTFSSGSVIRQYEIIGEYEKEHLVMLTGVSAKAGK